MNMQIEKALVPLVGLPCWAMGRSSSVFWFHFGEQREVPSIRRGTIIGAKTVGEYAIHVQCAWRIFNRNEIVVASADRYFPAGEDPLAESEDFDWSQPGVNRCDERLASLVASRINNPL